LFGNLRARAQTNSQQQILSYGVSVFSKQAQQWGELSNVQSV
jgi:hypothetical protein